jgi:hypothetical protein
VPAAPNPPTLPGAHQCKSIEVLGVAGLLEGAAQLEDLGVLLGRGMARVPALSGGGRGRKVEVVVLGLQRELSCRSSHIVDSLLYTFRTGFCLPV